MARAPAGQARDFKPLQENGGPDRGRVRVCGRMAQGMAKAVVRSSAVEKTAGGRQGRWDAMPRTVEAFSRTPAPPPFVSVCACSSGRRRGQARPGPQCSTIFIHSTRIALASFTIPVVVITHSLGK